MVSKYLFPWQFGKSSCPYGDWEHSWDICFQKPIRYIFWTFSPLLFLEIHLQIFWKVRLHPFTMVWPHLARICYRIVLCGTNFSCLVPHSEPLHVYKGWHFFCNKSRVIYSPCQQMGTPISYTEYISNKYTSWRLYQFYEHEMIFVNAILLQISPLNISSICQRKKNHNVLHQGNFFK